MGVIALVSMYVTKDGVSHAENAPTLSPRECFSTPRSRKKKKKKIGRHGSAVAKALFLVHVGADSTDI